MSGFLKEWASETKEFAKAAAIITPVIIVGSGVAIAVAMWVPHLFGLGEVGEITCLATGVLLGAFVTAPLASVIYSRACR